MNESAPALDPAKWQAGQRRFFVIVALGSVLLIGGMAALAAWDRSRRNALDRFTFTQQAPAWYSIATGKGRGAEVGRFLESPLYIWNLDLRPGSDRDLMPVGRLEESAVMVYQSRSEPERLREDGTGQYFIPVSPGRFLELTDFPPNP